MKARKGSAGDAMRHFKTADPLLYAAALPHYEGLLDVPRKRYTGQKLFAALAGAVVGQQLSTKAADAIWARLETVCGGTVTPEALQRVRVPTLRKAGLSAAKAKTLKELSKAVISGTLTLQTLKTLPEEEAVTRLSSIWGIGRWTAEMFLMFALMREDVFSPGDLGLRRAMETLYGLPKDVHIRELEAIAVTWSPHRTFACRVLWKLRDA